MHIVKAMFFPVAVCKCESWTLKKAEHQRIDASKLWCWGRLLRVPWTLRSPVNPKENQPWIFIGRTDAEAAILWPPDVSSQVAGKDPDAGENGGQGEKGVTEDEMVEWHHCSKDMSLSKLWEIGKDRDAWCAAVHGITKSWTWFSDWTIATTMEVTQLMLSGNRTKLI